MQNIHGSKVPYAAPQFERYGRVSELTQKAGKNNAVGTDAGTAIGNVAFKRTS